MNISGGGESGEEIIGGNDHKPGVAAGERDQGDQDPNAG